MSEPFFQGIRERIPFGGLDSADPLAYKIYDPDRVVLGKRMEDHLRIGVCYWHSFAYSGSDMFGSGTLDRPWLDDAADPMAAARTKMAAAFEFFAAGVYKLPDLLGPNGDGVRGQVLAGSVAAGIASYLSVRFLSRYFTNRTLMPFAAYSLVVGGLALIRFGL